MSLVGIGEAEARHRLGNIGSQNDELRQAVSHCNAAVDDLCHNVFRGATGTALRQKFDTEVLPKAERTSNHVDTTQVGTGKAIDFQAAHLAESAAGVQSC